MAKRVYSKRHAGYIQVKPHNRKKGVHVKGYCRRRPGKKSYGSDKGMPF